MGAPRFLSRLPHKDTTHMASHVRALTTWRKDAALLRLADLLNVAPVHAYGMITALTAHLMEQRKCGDLRSVPSSEIEHAAGWVGMPGHFASTVVNSYVDGRGQILHWMETAFPILKDREANTARVNAYRKKMREQQNQAADDFVSGTGGNGAASLSSASSTANQSAASPAPRRNAEGPDATRVRQSSPKSAPETPASPRTSSPRTVMGDTSPEHPANGSRIETSESRVENSLSDVESVMGDSVMGDSRNGYTHCASRAVVQDLEPKTEAVLGSRSLTASAVNHRSSLTAEISEAESNQLASKATALTALLIGIPKEMVAEIDGKDMPIECERLQGWRDGWTNVPKTTILQPDDAGLFGQAMTEIEYEYPSDAKRYRAIGNGVAEPVAAWIAWRIRLAAAEAYVKLQSSIHQ